MRAKILISVLAIALVSGCVIPGLPEVTPGIGAGRGLEITSFTVEPSPVFSGASVRVIMETANQGGTTVDIGEALAYLTGSNFDDWSGAAVGDCAGFTYNGTSGNCADQQAGCTDPAAEDDPCEGTYPIEGVSSFKDFDKQMKAEDVVRGIPASTDRFTWSLKAPALAAGQTRSDIFIGRIYHEYETSARGSIWVYPETEAEAARAAGRQMYSSSFTYSKGPVGVQVSVSPDPVVLYEGDNSFTVYVKISNLASGTIYSPGAVIYAANDISLTVDEINRVDVAVETSTDLSGYADCEGIDQELIAGRDLTLVCEVKISSTPDTFKSYTFDVTVSYGYYTERTATVTVQGR